MTRPGDALTFTIEPRALIYAHESRKVVRFDPPRLVADCPMPSCEWYVTAPDSSAGLALAEIGRRQHATTVHPEAVMAGGLVIPADLTDPGTTVLVLRSCCGRAEGMTHALGCTHEPQAVES